MKLLCTASYVFTRSLVEDDNGHIREVAMDNLGRYYFWDEPCDGQSQEDVQREFRELAADPEKWDKDCEEEFKGIQIFGDATKNWRAAAVAAR